MATKKQEHVVLNGEVRKQHYPIYEVRCKDTLIEWTDNRSDAREAYMQASKPAQFIRRLSAMQAPQLMECK